MLTPDSLLVIYFLLGLFAGVLAGLLGVGGGLVIVPVLIILFQYTGINTEYIAHTAIASSLVTIIPTSLSSIRAHHNKQSVLWSIAKKLSIGSIFGAFFGVYLAQFISTQILTQIVGGFAIVVSLYLFNKTQVKKIFKKFNLKIWIFSGSIIGSISTLVGIGGGSMTVPLLLSQGVHIKRAIGTSAACGLPIAIVGSLAFFYFGTFGAMGVKDTVDKIPYLHWPAIFAISAGTVLAAPLGARIAHHLPVTTLKKIFASLLLIIGVQLIF